MQRIDESELILSVIDQAINDYIAFALRANPIELTKKNSLHKNSPACITAQIDWWDPNDKEGCIEFFKSELLEHYLDLLDIDYSYFLSKLDRIVFESLGGYYQDLADFSFNVEGVGQMNNVLMHKRILELIEHIIKNKDMKWQKANLSYLEVVDEMKKNLSEEKLAEVDFWAFKNLNHIETLVGETADKTAKMYLGCFSREISREEKTHNKGPGCYKKYLLLMITEDNSVFEVRNAGKVAKTIYSLYFNESQEIQRDSQYRMLKFLEAMRVEKDEESQDASL